MRKSSIVLLSLFVTMFFLTTHIIPVVSAESTKAVQGISNHQKQEFYTGELPQQAESESSKTPTIDSSPQKQGLSKIKLAELAVISSFSPGISLLRVVLLAQEKGAHYDGVTLFFFTIIAILDFLVDKIPLLASFQQIVQHLIIWGVIYLGCQYLGADPATLGLLIGLALLGSIIQCVRTAYTIVTDATVVGAPARSVLEDIMAFLMLPL